MTCIPNLPDEECQSVESKDIVQDSRELLAPKGICDGDGLRIQREPDRIQVTNHDGCDQDGSPTFPLTENYLPQAGDEC